MKNIIKKRLSVFKNHRAGALRRPPAVEIDYQPTISLNFFVGNDFGRVIA